MTTHKGVIRGLDYILDPFTGSSFRVDSGGVRIDGYNLKYKKVEGYSEDAPVNESQVLEDAFLKFVVNKYRSQLNDLL